MAKVTILIESKTRERQWEEKSRRMTTSERTDKG